MNLPHEQPKPTWLPASINDYPEDHQTGGMYHQRCSQCQCDFSGRKGRIICKLCRDENTQHEVKGTK